MDRVISKGNSLFFDVFILCSLGRGIENKLIISEVYCILDVSPEVLKYLYYLIKDEVKVSDELIVPCFDINELFEKLNGKEASFNNASGVVA